MMALVKSAGALSNSQKFWGAAFQKWREKYGMPRSAGGWTKVPFDLFGDKLRGMDIMLDLYRIPDKVVEACERVLPYLVELGKLSGSFTPESPITVYPHRGNAPFLSLKQFEKFYWPTFKQLVRELTDAGFYFRLGTEGDWTMNIEYLKDLPSGKVIVHLDRTDIFKAKEAIGGSLCIEGNVPTDLLTLGTPARIEEYCKKLIENVGEGGGFIMDGGAGIPDGAPVENIRAMTNATIKYGLYRR